MLQGKALKPRKAPQHHAWRFESGAYIEVTWDQYKAGLGNTVSIQTGVCTSPASEHTIYSTGSSLSKSASTYYRLCFTSAGFEYLERGRDSICCVTERNAMPYNVWLSQ